jgi:hypothetical protein
MINEPQKAWRRKVSDKEWHEMLHDHYYDQRCRFCAERTTSQAFTEEAAYNGSRLGE